MPNLPMEEIERKVGSRYALTVLAGKRARELRDGAPQLVNADSNNPILIALQEIYEGKIFPENLDLSAPAIMVTNTGSVAFGNAGPVTTPDADETDRPDVNLSVPYGVNDASADGETALSADEDAAPKRKSRAKAKVADPDEEAAVALLDEDEEEEDEDDEETEPTDPSEE